MRSLIEPGGQVAKWLQADSSEGRTHILQTCWVAGAGATQHVRVAPPPHASPLVLQGVGAKTISCVLLFGLGVSGDEAGSLGVREWGRRVLQAPADAPLDISVLAATSSLLLDCLLEQLFSLHSSCSMMTLQLTR